MSSRREQKREETRKRLYEASIRVFRDQGVASARIDDIVSEVGVSRGTFYFHFPSKDDVLAQMMRESQEELVEALDSLAPDTPLEAVLDQVATRMGQQWQDDAQLLAEMGMVALRQTAQNLAELEESYPVQTALVPWFERAAARGEIHDLIPPVLLSEFFLVNLFGAALAWCGNQVVSLEELLRNVVRFFLRASRAPEPPAGQTD